MRLKLFISKTFVRSLLPVLLVCVAAAFSSMSVTAQNPADETRDAVALFNKGQDLHEKGDLAGAIKLYTEAIAMQPDFAEADYQLGVAQLAAGNFGESEKAFRNAIAVRPEWTLAQATLASLLVQENKLSEAEGLLKAVLDAEPQNPVALAAMADLRIGTGAGPAVLQDLLTKVSVLTSKSKPTASLLTAQAALENALGKKDQAKKTLASALAIEPGNRNALFQTADLALAEGDVFRAREALSRLDTRPAPNDDLKLLTARVLAAEGKLDDAASELRLVSNGNKATADLLAKIAAAQTSDPAELEKQLSTKPTDGMLLGKLCTLYRRTDPPKAADYCRRALQAEPSNLKYAVGFGAALVQNKQFTEAVDLLRKILTIAPDNATAHANLATALFQLKRYPEAKTEFTWIVSADPRSAAAYYFLGIVFDQLAEYMDAAANYQQYLRLADPVANKDEMDKVNLRLPALQRLIKDGKGKKKSL